jgi:hypothetical protein
MSSSQQASLLRKALYGLHEAPCVWNVKLDDTLLSLSIQRTPSEHAIYVRRNDSVQPVVGVYVNDESSPAQITMTSGHSRWRWQPRSK